MAAVFFDLDGTLLSFDRPYDRLLERTFEARIGRSSAAIVDAYSEAFFTAFEAMETDPVERGMTAAVEECDLDVAPAQLAAELLEQEVTAATPTDGAERLLDALDGHHLGVLTDGEPDWQAAKLAGVGLDDRFEVVLTSYGIGAHKPDSESFAAARAAVDADRYVMVGDDREGDVEGARAAGFDAVHYDPGSETAVRVDGLGALADVVEL